MLIEARQAYTIDPDLKYRNPMGVFKLTFGKKYFIFKGMKVANTVENLSKQMDRELRSPKDDSILIKVVTYLNRQRIKVFNVEMIFESDAVIDVLMSEYEALQAAKDDPDCLNCRFTNNEYFPNWVPQMVINDFNKRLQGIPPTNHDKNLLRFLNNHIEDKELVEKIFKYVVQHFRAASRRKKDEGHKDIPKKRTD